MLTAATVEAFQRHPGYAIITSFPWLADITGACVRAEIGGDRHRFTDASALQAYAGSAPVTRASGRSISITRRVVKNDRRNGVGRLRAFATIARPGPAKAHYDRRRARGDRHVAASRHLFNRFLGQLHHCLQTGQTYDSTTAVSSSADAFEPAAADTQQDRRHASP